MSLITIIAVQIVSYSHVLFFSSWWKSIWYLSYICIRSIEI